MKIYSLLVGLAAAQAIMALPQNGGGFYSNCTADELSTERYTAQIGKETMNSLTLIMNDQDNTTGRQAPAQNLIADKDFVVLSDSLNMLMGKPLNVGVSALTNKQEWISSVMSSPPTWVWETHNFLDASPRRFLWNGVSKVSVSGKYPINAQPPEPNRSNGRGVQQPCLSIEQWGPVPTEKLDAAQIISSLPTS